MGDLQRYIVEEWVEEYQQGRLNRREFLRRMAIMAGGAAVALPLLRSLGITATDDEVAAAAASGPPVVAQTTGVTVPPNDPSLEAMMVSYASGAVPVLAYFAQPKNARGVPGVIVIHENRGLLEHFKDVARRFAKAGYAALAVDLASGAGGTAKFTDSAEVTAVLGRTPPDTMVGFLRGGVRYLQNLSTVARDRIGAMGFCFGGGMTWRLSTQEPVLRAAAPFYGSNPPLEQVPNIKAAVLAVYGALDERLNAGIPAVREALTKANVVHEVMIYPGADHAFFNDTGARYKADAAQDAWRRVLGWFDRHLKV